jgi:hypothetical protein
MDPVAATPETVISTKSQVNIVAMATGFTLNLAWIGSLRFVRLPSITELIVRPNSEASTWNISLLVLKIAWVTGPDVSLELASRGPNPSPHDSLASICQGPYVEVSLRT